LQHKDLQDGGHNTPKDNTLNKCSNQDFISISLPVIVTPMLKVVRKRNARKEEKDQAAVHLVMLITTH